jgi:hypothetical protein
MNIWSPTTTSIAVYYSLVFPSSPDTIYKLILFYTQYTTEYFQETLFLVYIHARMYLINADTHTSQLYSNTNYKPNTQFLFLTPPTLPLHLSSLEILSLLFSVYAYSSYYPHSFGSMTTVGVNCLLLLAVLHAIKSVDQDFAIKHRSLLLLTLSTDPPHRARTSEAQHSEKGAVYRWLLFGSIVCS